MGNHFYYFFAKRKCETEETDNIHCGFPVHTVFDGWEELGANGSKGHVDGNSSGDQNHAPYLLLLNVQHHSSCQLNCLTIPVFNLLSSNSSQTKQSSAIRSQVAKDLHPRAGAQLPYSAQGSPLTWAAVAQHVPTINHHCLIAAWQGCIQ